MGVNVILPVNEIVQRYANKESTLTLGRFFSVSPTTIRARLLDAGVTLRSSNWKRPRGTAGLFWRGRSTCRQGVVPIALEGIVHTSGPWTIRPKPRSEIVSEHNDDPYTIVANGRFIATIKNQAGEAVDNATLISAAPDLLSACYTAIQEMRLMNRKLRTIGRGHPEDGAHLDSAVQVVLAAIAKALA